MICLHNRWRLRISYFGNSHIAPLERFEKGCNQGSYECYASIVNSITLPLVSNSESLSRISQHSTRIMFCRTTFEQKPFHISAERCFNTCALMDIRTHIIKTILTEYWTRTVYIWFSIKIAYFNPQLIEFFPLLEAQRCEKSPDRYIKRFLWTVLDETRTAFPD